VRVVQVDPRSLPKTIDGGREAWSIVEETWAATSARSSDRISWDAACVTSLPNWKSEEAAG
jgi:hypothetical protein